MDPFFVSKSFRFPVYFFASDDLFNLKVSPLIRYLAAPIPKSKSVADPKSVIAALRILREGGAVGIAPEGNRTLSGRLWWKIPEAVAKLVKTAKCPLVLYNLCGGFGTDPRWGTKIRKGTRFDGFVKRILDPKDYADLSVDELFSIIKKELDVDDTASGEHYRSRKRAEHIERALYICPVCRKTTAQNFSVRIAKQRQNIPKRSRSSLLSAATPIFTNGSNGNAGKSSKNSEAEKAFPIRVSFSATA